MSSLSCDLYTQSTRIPLELFFAQIPLRVGRGFIYFVRHVCIKCLLVYSTEYRSQVLTGLHRVRGCIGPTLQRREKWHGE